jgi:hypothetical protein
MAATVTQISFPVSFYFARGLKSSSADFCCCRCCCGGADDDETNVLFDAPFD